MCLKSGKSERMIKSEMCFKGVRGNGECGGVSVEERASEGVDYILACGEISA